MLERGKGRQKIRSKEFPELDAVCSITNKEVLQTAAVMSLESGFQNLNLDLASKKKKRRKALVFSSLLLCHCAHWHCLYTLQLVISLSGQKGLTAIC